jgi:TIR domain
MGAIISPRCVATANFVVEAILGSAFGTLDSTSTATLSFRIASSQSSTLIPAQLVGLSPIRSGYETGWRWRIAILQVSAEDQDFLLPSQPISARDANFYFDRKIRMLVSSHRVGDLYCSASLEGLLPSGLVQIQTSMSVENLRGSAGTPIWDLDTGHVLGILIGIGDTNDGIAYMASTQSIANAWPNLEVRPAVPNKSDERKISGPKIFICHANEDTAVATEVYKNLQSAGYDPWLDKMSIIPGQKWDFEIKKAVRKPNFL